MQTYTESEQEPLSFLLEQAARDGEVRIRREDGALFVLRPETAVRSALDVAGINLNVSTQEIIDIVREGRER
ncbi:MAG TPA: type II toxin-antitoxin system Phd/YefM family antitoxin [Blastocatellia bacterium]|nr:type II toxin-antitoxin system Phd/YefM family antitoxin [Blastocatellia bacterium]HMV85213.1 type II toxin-antitoxin system Phd/YefM family antitoxin [Blastocatellia bacterium]HMX24581.1 type II toxin-antitoxin system Phd/YefM family antitoxin [Blastocatellia bacterium]HMY72283.1 type II toxin-antitoxin system Phd/YefM family antitoxin [Blastocatellia bacterium]HMZ18328.1 type II toxin-antitoxin system Phd/YefM family antitoxin [Blastocatellia bacterium]